MTSLAVIVSTYNNPRALNLVLTGLERQTRPPQEVLIADDGSGAETAALIESWTRRPRIRCAASGIPTRGSGSAAS
jgi:glycosyltransferase involved in cell wall biosynthesis